MTRLHDFIDAYASKSLAHVDLPFQGSNQHELNGSASLRKLLGSEKIEGKITWIRFSDSNEPQRLEGCFTFYDARAKSAERTGRSEWRFYYDDSLLPESEVGDLLILLRLKGSTPDQLTGLIFPYRSSWHSKAQLLFESAPLLTFYGEDETRQKEIGFAERYILSLLGFETQSVEPDIEKVVEEHLPANIISTKQMAALVHSLAPSSFDADQDLIRWLTLEEKIFYSWERREVSKRLERGFSDVEDFLKFSLSVQNRRKSRMGYSLENHLEKVFIDNKIKYSSKKATENGEEPDFLFPGINEYNSPSFPDLLLTMLGAKSTLKDRWRQVLSEADRITQKHLCTLEPAISPSQTTQIASKGVVLVIPIEIQATYSDSQRTGLLSVQQFVSLVKDRQDQSIQVRIR